MCEKWDGERHCCKACTTCELKYEWRGCTDCQCCHFQKCMGCKEVFCCSHSAMFPNKDDWPKIATCFQCWPTVRATINETATLPLPVHDHNEASSSAVTKELYEVIPLPPELVHLLLVQNCLSFCTQCQRWYQPNGTCEDCDSKNVCPHCVKQCESPCGCCLYCHSCSLKREYAPAQYKCSNLESPCVVNSSECVRHSQDWCFQCQQWFCPVHHVEVEEFADAMCVTCWKQVQDRIDREAAKALLQ